MGSAQVARGQVEGDDKGEGSAGEDEMLDSIKSPTQSKSPANRKRIGGSPWYKKGTSVVLNCGPGVKPGNPNPMVALADLVDRPVRRDVGGGFCGTRTATSVAFLLLQFSRRTLMRSAP